MVLSASASHLMNWSCWLCEFSSNYLALLLLLALNSRKTHLQKSTCQNWPEEDGIWQNELKRFHSLLWPTPLNASSRSTNASIACSSELIKLITHSNELLCNRDKPWRGTQFKAWLSRQHTLCEIYLHQTPCTDRLGNKKLKMVYLEN